MKASPIEVFFFFCSQFTNALLIPDPTTVPFAPAFYVHNSDIDFPLLLFRFSPDHLTAGGKGCIPERHLFDDDDDEIPVHISKCLGQTPGPRQLSIPPRASLRSFVRSFVRLAAELAGWL